MYAILVVVVRNCVHSPIPPLCGIFFAHERHPVEPLDHLPAVLQEPDMVAILTQSPSVRDFIRDNFGLYSPPGDYKAIRAENLRRTQRALERACGNN
jgi:hypothetical protein